MKHARAILNLIRRIFQLVYGVWHLQTADCRSQIADCKLNDTKNLSNKGDVIKNITSCEREKVAWEPGARSIQPKFPEISVQNSMDRLGPTGKKKKKRVHLLRWTTFPGPTGWNFGWMDRAQGSYFCAATLASFPRCCWLFDLHRPSLNSPGISLIALILYSPLIIVNW